MDRRTLEPTPDSPELLAFTTAEAVLAVRAVSYYVVTELQIGQVDRDKQGMKAVGQNASDALEGVGKIAQFVAMHQGLAEKLLGCMTQPEEPVELSPEEIQSLGMALFRLGNFGVKYARNALQHGGVILSPAKRAIVSNMIEGTAKDTFSLFERLQPIANCKNISWMTWKAPSALPRAS